MSVSSRSDHLPATVGRHRAPCEPPQSRGVLPGTHSRRIRYPYSCPSRSASHRWQHACHDVSPQLARAHALQWKFRRLPSTGQHDTVPHRPVYRALCCHCHNWSCVCTRPAVPHLSRWLDAHPQRSLPSAPRCRHLPCLLARHAPRHCNHRHCLPRAPQRAEPDHAAHRCAESSPNSTHKSSYRQALGGPDCSPQR